MVKAKAFVYAKPFEGSAQLSNFRLIEEELLPLKDGEYLLEALYLSVDPYIRGTADRLQIGEQITGGQVGRIIESKHPNFAVGKIIVGHFGWRTHTICDGNAKVDPTTAITPPYFLPEIGNLSFSLAVGVLGMPGNAGYFGLLEILHPKAGETLVVSSAAGAVGSLVGEIGKMKGLKVIGIAGSDEKGKWLTDDLGFDHFINYKTENVSKRLKELAPDGIDCYFDNTGGDITKAVYDNIKVFGRVSICGCIAAYDGDEAMAYINQRTILLKQLKIEGFIVDRWGQRWMEGIEQNLKWIQEGKLKTKETLTEGFENMPKAFIDMMKGGNTGKAVIKA